MDSSLTATYFRNIGEDVITEKMVVMPPWEPKGSQNQWVRGNIKLNDLSYIYHSLKDFVVTGPKMKVCYSGCKWNRLCLALTPDAEVSAFRDWLSNLSEEVRSIIWCNPEKFKPGAKTNTRFLFDQDIFKKSSDPNLYPDELRCKLSSSRQSSMEEGVPVYEDLVDANLFMLVDGRPTPVDASAIQAGWYVVPVIKFSYYRNVERFGLTMTVIKGHVIPVEQGPRGPMNEEWVIDYQTNMEV